MKMAEKKPVKKQKEEKKDASEHAAKPSHKTEAKQPHTDAKEQKETKHVHKDAKDLKPEHRGTKEMKKPAENEEKAKSKPAEKVDKQKTARGGFSPAISKKAVLHAYQTLIHPLITEKAINMIESENKLVFVVRNNATRQEVKKAVEELYGVKVDSVNIMRDMKARKRAFVRINEKFRADEIATKLGVL